MMRRRTKLVLGGTLAAVALISWTGCFTAPAISTPPTLPLGEALRHYPTGSEPVATPVGDDGAHLRGLFVPAAGDAPVVLHLLGSGGSVASDGRHFGAVAEALRDLGYASLLLDYRGVGSSDGEPSPDHLARDAAAMFAEATRRAGGEPGRVVVRAISLGTVAAAHLLAGGARPGGLALLLPVRGRDVSWRFADAVLGGFAGSVAWWALRPVARVELTEALAQARDVPLLFVRPTVEQLAAPAWLDELRALATARTPAYGHAATRDGDHFQVGIEANQLLVPEELDFFTRALGLVPVPEAATLRALRLRWALAPWPRTAAPPPHAALLSDLRDPAGAVPLDLVESWGHRVRFLERHATSGRPRWTPEAIAARAQARGRGAPERYTVVLTEQIAFEVVFDHAALFDQVLARGFAGAAARRVLARIQLKAFGLADRVVAMGASLVLEAWHDERWVPVRT